MIHINELLTTLKASLLNLDIYEHTRQLQSVSLILINLRNTVPVCYPPHQTLQKTKFWKNKCHFTEAVIS